ncbi:MAG: hypothetical protein MMC33_002863 [Icmadophila ericetorum]|nr:hypothetical protein [Icmadophila ericetorum]
MQLPRKSLLSAALLLFPTLSTAELNCEQIVVEGITFNLQPLKGPRYLTWLHDTGHVKLLNNASIDICQSLKIPKEASRRDFCDQGARICDIQKKEDSDEIFAVIPIAGVFALGTGGALEPHYTRLKTLAVKEYDDQEGVLVEIGGGKDTDGRKQKAAITFECTKGNDEGRRSRRIDGDEEGGGDDKKKDDEDDGKKDKVGESMGDVDDGKGGTIKFLSRRAVNEYDVLKIKWLTKYACEDSPGEKSSLHWGFFTWIFVIAFLSIATYLIFGSWLNYSRYGARGWDLLPHSDTIRDVPYILQDWGRKVVETVQGGGSRGGYSAV